MTTSVIEEPSDAEDILPWQQIMLKLMVLLFFIHAQDIQITKSNLIDALLTLNDALSQTWIVGSGASFHVTPIKECFTTFNAGSHRHIYLRHNHDCSIEGIWNNASHSRWYE